MLSRRALMLVLLAVILVGAACSSSGLTAPKTCTDTIPWTC
jgi:hypothetical protein